MKSTFFLFANPHKPDTVSAAKRLADILLSKGAEIIMDEWLHEQLRIGQGQNLGDVNEKLSAIVSLGGDGTLLRTIPKAAEFRTPILGINMGHIGFLMEAESWHLSHVAERLLSQDYFIEERMLLKAQINQDEPCLVLNDIALLRGQYPSSIEVRAYADEESIFTVRGDGVLVSTPTGTTAYAMSAGGPVISPFLDCIAVVPVCSHVLYQRPVILPTDVTIRLCMTISPGKTHQAIVDGQIVVPVADETCIVIRKAMETARFIRFSKQLFLTRLKEKQAEWSRE